MQKVTGIKSVDFKITAYGHGVVNWNRATQLEYIDPKDNKRKSAKNHTLPKLRGYSNIKHEQNTHGETYERPKLADDINFKETPLYISQNCIRHHLFKDEIFNWVHPQIHENINKVLCSLTGLVRGYLIPKNENKRTSALLLTDFTELLGNGNYEQMGRSGSKEKQETKSGKEKSNSHFSKTTFGDTKYEAYGSISVEQLQFISLSSDFGQEAMSVSTNKEGEKLAKEIENYIKSLNNWTEDVKATYHHQYLRAGTIFADGQKGILLNDAAIDVLIKEVLDMISNLEIRQAKGCMYVDKLIVDYNSISSIKNMFRIEDNEHEIDNVRKSDYAVYYFVGE